MTLPPLSAIGNVFVEIFGPTADAPRWDMAEWDEAYWAGTEWRDVTPEAMQIQVSWGADDPAGALTVPAAGSWQLDTYDPARRLDPSNGSSEFAASIRPGRPIRIIIRETGFADFIVRQGFIDDVAYDLATAIGSLRGTDGVALMVAAKMQANQTGLPTTLRAFARAILARVGLGTLFTVEDDPINPDTGLPYDPPIGVIDSAASDAWTHIMTAAFDALYAVWLDRLGTIRFRSFGGPVDRGIQLGGVDGIPVSTIKTQASLKAVYTRVSTYDITAPTVQIVANNTDAQQAYGILEYHRDRPVPNAQAWVDSVLADRESASLQYNPGTIYPTNMADLQLLMDAGMVALVRIVGEQVYPPMAVDARLLGAYFRADAHTGWTATVVTYIPSEEWDEAEAPPIDPPIDPEEPPPISTHKETRYYDCIKDSRAARTPGGSNYGSGTEGELPVGAWQGWRNRAFIDFDQISFAGVVSVDAAYLELDTTSQVNIGFGSSPKITVYRVTEAWSEGSASSPSGSNALVYPGPAATSTGGRTVTVTRSENASVSIGITEIARAWKSGSSQQGVRVTSAGEDNEAYTTEFWDRSNSTTSRRPRLRLDVTVQD